MKTLTEPRIHTATNLYNYIKNLRQAENLRLQIERKEDELATLEQLNEIYEHFGCTSILELSSKRAGKLVVDILLLNIEKNNIEEQLQKFETAVRLED